MVQSILSKGALSLFCGCLAEFGKTTYFLARVIYIFTDEIQKNVVAVLSNIVVENKKRIILLNRIIEISLI